MLVQRLQKFQEKTVCLINFETNLDVVGESAKFRALRVLMSYMPCASCALVPHMPRALRALVSYVPCAPRALVPHVPRALHALVLYVPIALRTLVPHVLRVLQALMPYVPRALSDLMPQVPCVQRPCANVILPYLMPYMLLCPTCLVPYLF